jgi:hypothetical protein
LSLFATRLRHLSMEFLNAALLASAASVSFDAKCP